MYSYSKRKFNDLEIKVEDGVKLRARIQSNRNIKNEVLLAVYKSRYFQ